MQKFRKKPVVIEAIQYNGDNLAEVLAFTGKHPRWDEWFSSFEQYQNYVRADGFRFKILTLEGTMIATPGDWIIRGVKGEFYPCKPDIFTVTYESDDTFKGTVDGDTPLQSAERADYEEVLADIRRLTKLLDVAMHGEEGAAKQASLCDLIEPAKRMRAKLAAVMEALIPFADCCDHIRDDEDDEEWAKFRLLVKDYRHARAAVKA